MNCLQNPPALDINKLLYDNYGKTMPPHVRLEQRIVWNLLLTLEKAGFEPESFDDGDERIRTVSKKKVMEELFNRDEAYVFFSHSKEKLASGSLRTVWIRFVLGNELDIISDYTASNWHDFETVVSKFDPEVYA